MSPTAIVILVLCVIGCFAAEASECSIPTSPRALSGTNDTQDYKFIHVSSSQVSPGGKWTIGNFILNSHQSSLLPVKWEKGMIEFQNIHSGSCASSSLETFAPVSEDLNAPILYGIGAGLRKPAHAWVCQPYANLGTFHDTPPLEGKITAHLMDGEKPLLVDISITSRLGKNTFFYEFRNRSDYPLRLDITDFAREWQESQSRGKKWVESRRPENSIFLTRNWVFEASASEEYLLVQRLKRIGLYSATSGRLLGVVQVPILLPGE